MSSNIAFSSSTSERYALALYELAKEKSELKKTEQEARTLKELLSKSDDFKNVVSSPIIGRQDQIRAILKIAEHLKFSKIFEKFLGLITLKGRLFFLNKIIENFLKLISISKGELTAQLISSRELSNDEIILMQKNLSTDLKNTLKINYNYNPNLIGGFTLKIGSVMIDTSIKNKLKRLEKMMIES